jgi:glycosyltransferase involved in cell wall biosynthesis
MAEQGELAVSIVLPAYNEEGNIEQAISEATAVAERLFREHEVIVVDDGSSDATGELASAVAQRDPRVRVIGHDRNRGYGEAIRAGFMSAQRDHIFFTDADLQFDLNNVEGFLQYAGVVDVIAGYRVNRRDPRGRRLMAWAWNLLVRALFYVPVPGLGARPRRSTSAAVCCSSATTTTSSRAIVTSRRCTASWECRGDRVAAVKRGDVLRRQEPPVHDAAGPAPLRTGVA